jgi:hypothetical protein
VTWTTILVTGNNLCPLPITAKVTDIKEKPVTNMLVQVTWDTISVTSNNQPVRLAYQPPASSNFLSQQTSHQQPASSTLLSEQTSTSHQPPANRTG